MRNLETMEAVTETVQVDSGVIMKMMKHFESERQLGGTPQARGYLTGLIAVEERRLELTNCFHATSRCLEDSEEDLYRQQEEVQGMLRRFRNMNMDYELLGFYESASFGSAFTKTFLESMLEYQQQLEDSVVLLYDNTKTAAGLLAFRAFRLSPAALRCFAEDGDLFPDKIKAAGLSHSSLFVELPILIKNSHLVNVALAEMQLLRPMASKAPFLDLAHSGSLEKCLRGLMDNLDNLNAETNRYNKYAAEKAKHDAIRDTQLAKRRLENEARRARGEPELPMEEAIKAGKALLPHSLTPTLLAAAQVSGFLRHASQTSAHNLHKLFLTEALLGQDSGKLRDRAASIPEHK